ncbi:hypothetical protein MtrunA17_Chr2g0313251 [Medicago truncatula]|uniref:Uncharacterized protein n=1 Tax=Medicago truncatula TaxID=3880 RepID=A0A396JI03_MEDTR|nr:uncharacterized protein LOC11426136 [Medicago truncatula]RHN74707.1 hypothetical protein MtrunA17_Chr2g0313251 [Medicago truncatula]
MASQVCETLAYDVEMKGDLLMSLMEELPCDESNDERLDSLIRSFEAEISESKMGGHDNSTCIGSQLKSNFEEYYNESWNIGQVVEEGYHDFGVEWVDMDMMTSFQFDDGSNWGDEKDVMIDHFMVGDDGFDMEEHAYNSFWQDSYEIGLVH